MTGHDFIRLDMSIDQDRARLLNLIHDAQLTSSDKLRTVADVTRETETE